MNKLFWIACALSLLHAGESVAQTASDDFATRYATANSAHDLAESQKILGEWKKAQPDNPEYYIAAANYLIARSRSVDISTKPAGPDDLVVADPKTHKPVGSLGASGPPPWKAARDILRTGLSHAPQRMDIYLGIATLDEKIDDSGDLLKNLRAMAKYANEHPTTIQGRGGRPYPPPVDETLSKDLNDIATDYFARERKESNRVFRNLAQLDIDAFPQREYGYNLLGGYYRAMEKDLPRALSNYEKALQLVPTDSLVWMNAGSTHAEMGDNAAAIVAFKKVVQLNNSPDLVKAAQATLKKIK